MSKLEAEKEEILNDAEEQKKMAEKLGKEKESLKKRIESCKEKMAEKIGDEKDNLEQIKEVSDNSRMFTVQPCY